MRTIILSITFFLMIGVANAQEAKAKEILNQASEKSKNYKSLSGTFDYVLENSTAGVSDKSSGSFKLKGEKYFVDVMGYLNYFDGKSVYSYIKDANEVTITEPDLEDEDFMSPSKLLSICEKGFTYNYVSETTENGERLHVIDLFPEDKSKEFSRIILKINKSSLLITSMKSIGKSGDNVTVNVTKYRTNTDLKESEFQFQESDFPGVEIVDMR